MSDSSPSTRLPPLQYADRFTDQQGVSRRGNLILAASGSDLGPRCIKCGEPGDTAEYSKTFHWYSKWIVLLLLLAGLLPGFIYIAVRQKTGKLEFRMCKPHCWRRWKGMALATLFGTLGAAGVILSFGLAISSRRGTLTTMAVFLLAVGCITMAAVMGTRASTLNVVKITGAGIWVRGARPAFLETLPPVIESHK